jgi:hypothetical protein
LIQDVEVAVDWLQPPILIPITESSMVEYGVEQSKLANKKAL